MPTSAPDATALDPSRSGRVLASLLRPFGEVRPREAVTVVLLSLDVFLVLASYYLLKVAREPLILLGGGAEVKAYASVGQSVLLVPAAAAYGWLAARVSRTTLISCVTLFFAANLIAFWALGRHGVKSLGVPFFLWVGIFNVITVAQFWSFAADLYTEEQGKRLFPVVGIGSSVGAVGGAAIAAPLIRRGSPFSLMLVAAGVLASTVLLTHIVHRRDAHHARRAGLPAAHEEPLGYNGAFALAARDRYLLLFGVLVLVLNVVTRTGDYVLDRMLLAGAGEASRAQGLTASVYIGQFKARYFETLNILSVVLQSFVVSRVIRHLGLRWALVIVPIASLGGYAAGLAFPLLRVLVVGRMIESSLDYSLSNTTRHALWLVTAREAKYKAKQVLDTFVMRAGDALSAGLVWVGTLIALGPRGFLLVNVILSVVWVSTAVVLGREHRRRSAAVGELQGTKAA